MACADRAQSMDGRALAISNANIFGGYIARYVDSGADYPSHECTIDGIACIAGEARFGGIVIQTIA